MATTKATTACTGCGNPAPVTGPRYAVQYWYGRDLMVSANLDFKLILKVKYRI